MKQNKVTGTRSQQSVAELRLELRCPQAHSSAVACLLDHVSPYSFCRGAGPHDIASI